MIDHTGVSITDPARSRKFYESALAPLGYKVLMEVPAAATGGVVVFGMGVPPKPDFWVHEGTPQRPHVHIAFRADSRSVVDAFYTAAMAASKNDGGNDDAIRSTHCGRRRRSSPPPWHGTGACAKWASDFDADAKKNGITDGVVTLSKPSHVDITADRAYLVIPANYMYKQKGKSVSEVGSIITLTLQKVPAGWRITGWSWAKH